MIHAPNAPYNLVLIEHMTDAKLTLQFKGVYTPGTSKEILRGQKIGHLYYLNAKINTLEIALVAKVVPVGHKRNRNGNW